MTTFDTEPVVIYTLPDEINRVHLSRREDHMILIPIQSGNVLESAHDKIITINILEDILQVLDRTPNAVEIRFPLDPERDLELGQIVEYTDEKIRIGVLSYLYQLKTDTLIVQASFIK